MRARVVCFLSLALLTAACTSKPDQREYTLQGQVLAVAPDRHQATINHEEVKGLMAAMTMPYSVHDPKQLEGIAPGDLINAKLVVLPSDAYLTDVKKVGEAPLPTGAGGSAGGVLGVRAAQARRGGPGREVRGSGRQEAELLLVQGIDGPDHLHLHALSDADVLPADGSALRGDPEETERRRGHEGTYAPGERELRSARRYATGAEGAREEARRRPEDAGPF